MAEPISRRSVLLASAALAASPRLALGGVQAAAAAAPPIPTLDPAWRPKFLSGEQAQSVALLAETILPRTSTPGAIEARVHEWIDLELSLQPAADARRFVDGLAWMEKRARQVTGKTLVAASSEERVKLLQEISDEAKPSSEELAPGVRFFEDLKRRTIFGYYTSEVGRTKGLGLPEAVTMETFRGCTHRDGEHG
jgi:hypothetical protein